jgi:hypothetical protein
MRRVNRPSSAIPGVLSKWRWTPRPSSQPPASVIQQQSLGFVAARYSGALCRAASELVVSLSVYRAKVGAMAQQPGKTRQVAKKAITVAIRFFSSGLCGGKGCKRMIGGERGEAVRCGGWLRTLGCQSVRLLAETGRIAWRAQMTVISAERFSCSEPGPRSQAARTGQQCLAA